MVLKEFFAVTETSVYRVDAKPNAEGLLTIEKLALDGQSVIAKGARVSGGDEIEVAPDGLRFFHRGGGQRFFALAKTSPLTALFLNEFLARRCHQAKDRKPLDPRWLAETGETLSAIGTAHPTVTLAPDLVRRVA
jgi:hypothetical protein